MWNLGDWFVACEATVVKDIGYFLSNHNRENIVYSQRHPVVLGFRVEDYG